jgi:hypothetical protein
MDTRMSRSTIARYVTPWKFRREQQHLRRVVELRRRDGDDCRRCRRPVRFDLPRGHDLGPSIEQVLPTAVNEEETLDNFCLTHRRCNASGKDVTCEVQERVRRKNEAELFAKAKRRA